MDQNFNHNSENTSNGPQFDLAETNGWGGQSREWLSKYGSSVILPIVALAILASGIYLYATQKRQENNIFLEQSPATIVAPEQAEDSSDEAIVVTEQQENVQEEVISEQIKEILPVKQDDQVTIKLKAKAGEGVTHLARRALKDYLTQDTDLTKEHKIYIEDYIKDNIGSKTLEVGEEIEISENLIQDAINSANTLTAEQLKIIEQFSALVTEI